MFANLSKKVSLFLSLTIFCLHIFIHAQPQQENSISKKNTPPAISNPREKSESKSGRYRKHRKNREREPHLSTQWKELSTEQLEDKLVYAKKIADLELTLKILQQLAKTAQQNAQLNRYLLELADFYFESKQLEKAIEYYQSYCALYPGSRESEYAGYKSILASFYTTLQPNRDITATEKTITLATTFLTQVVRKDYKNEVEQIIRDCNQKLFQHEVYVFEHYLQQQKYKPAQMRLDYIERHFLDSIKDAQRLMPHLKSLLALVKNPDTRPFIIHVDWAFNLDQTAKKSSVQKVRHVNKVKF